MRPFKFFQKIKRTLGDNMYLGFNMDECLINTLRYKQIHNQEILNNSIQLTSINVPISNCWLTITSWRTEQSLYPQPEQIEVDYTISEVNTTPRQFTLRTSVAALMEQIDVHQRYHR